MNSLANERRGLKVGMKKVLPFQGQTKHTRLMVAGANGGKNF